MAKKKGFMTPERKKKLRTLLRKKAVEELKKEQVGQFHQHFTSSFFCTKVFCAVFLCLRYGFVIFLQKEIGAKADRKMLVKLTTTGEESWTAHHNHCSAMRQQGWSWSHGRGGPEESCQAILWQVVQPGRRDVLPSEGGHSPWPANQWAPDVCQWHEGQIHQANVEEGLQVREQVCQVAREGSQIRLCQPNEGQGEVIF